MKASDIQQSGLPSQTHSFKQNEPAKEKEKMKTVLIFSEIQRKNHGPNNLNKP